MRPATGVGRTDAHATRATPVTSAQVWNAWARATRYWSAGRWSRRRSRWEATCPSAASPIHYA